MLSSHLVDVYSPLFNLMTSRLIPCATLAPAIPAVRAPVTKAGGETVVSGFITA